MPFSRCSSLFCLDLWIICRCRGSLVQNSSSEKQLNLLIAVPTAVPVYERSYSSAAPAAAGRSPHLHPDRVLDVRPEPPRHLTIYQPENKHTGLTVSILHCVRIRRPGLNRPPLLSIARLNGKSYRINLILPLFISPSSGAGWDRSCDSLEKCEGVLCLGAIVLLLCLLS